MFEALLFFHHLIGHINMTKSEIKKTGKKTKLKKEDQPLLKSLKGKLKESKKELLAQVEQLSQEISEFKRNSSSKKIIKKLEKNYKKQISNLQQEFHEQFEKLQSMQSTLIERLPEELLDKLKLSPEEELPAQVKTKSETSTPKPAVQSKSELSAIKGIGPVTVKKLQAVGITSLTDLANTPADKKEALQAFEKVKGFETWAPQAKKLLSEE